MSNRNALYVPQELLILGAAVETGIIESLFKKALTSDELAKKIHSDKRAVWTVTEALVALGYLKKEKGKLKLTNISKNWFFDKSFKDYMGFSFMHSFYLVKRWVQLPEIIQSGKPTTREPDKKGMQYFIQAMRHGAKSGAQPIVEFLLKNRKPGTTVIDLGGGPLIHASEFARQGAKVSVLDIPEVVEMYKSEAKKYKITLIKGDFNKTLPHGSFDIAYLGNICHIIGEKENQNLIKKVSRILNPGGIIAICDFIRGSAPGASLFGVNMLVNTEKGNSYSLQQYTQWLKNAGFKKVELHHIAERQIMSGQK